MASTAPLNITLSIGDVSFHLTPSSTNDCSLNSPPTRTNSSYAVHRKRHQMRRSGSGRTPFPQQQQHASSPPIVAIRHGSSRSVASLPNNHFSPTTPRSSPRNQSPLQQHILGRVRSMRDAFEAAHEGRKSAAPQAQSPLLSPRDSTPGDYCVDLHSFTGTLHISSLKNNNNDERTNYAWEQKRGGALFNSPLISPRKRAARNVNDDEIVWLSTKRIRSVTSISCDENGERMSRATQRGNDSQKAVRFSEGGSSTPTSLLHSNAKPTSPSSGDKGNNGNAASQNTIHNNNAQPRSPPQPQQTQPPKPKGAKFFSRPQASFSSPPRDAMGAIGSQSKSIARGTSSVLARSSKHFLKQITLAGKDAYVAFNGEAVVPLNGAATTSNSTSPNRRIVGSARCINGGGNVQGEAYDASGGTELHYACASDNLDHIRSLLEYDSLADLRKEDKGGKLPIHIFAENKNLITADPLGCEEVAFKMIQFMGPDNAVHALNSNGLAPFVSIIGAWTERLHTGATAARNSIGVVGLSSNAIEPPSGNPPSGPTAAQSDEENQGSTTTVAPSASNNVQSRRRRVAYRSLFHSSTPADRSLVSSTDRAKLLYLPASVAISDHVRWAIHILSRLIDEEYPAQIREAILTNMACVPLFLKSLLLIHDEYEMMELLDASLVKHVVVDKRSIGVWLCAMLTGPREVKMRAVTFMKLLSQMTLQDLAAASKSPDRYSDEEVERFTRLHEDTFNAVYVTRGIVPAVLGLGGQMIENLSTTRVMRYITDRTIRKESVFFVLICDFFYSIFLLMGYRSSVEFVLNYHSVGELQNLQGKNCMRFSTIAIASYFLVKEAMAFLSLYLTSKKLAKRYCLSVFNIIDVAAVVMVLGIENALSSSIDNGGWAASMTIILLWLKLMGAFKILNAAFALFLYAVDQVIREVKWFLLFLVAVVLMFSDAARTVVAVRGDCHQNTIEEVTKEFCSDNLMSVIIRMYAVLAGDVGLEYFQSSDAMVAVFVFFSFFSIIILLNILIAIILDSYEGSKQRTREIFYRARIEYAAHLVARKQFLTPKQYSDFHVATYIPQKVRRGLSLIYRLVSVVAALMVEYSFLGAIHFLSHEMKYDMMHSLMVVYLCVGGIFNLYVFSVAAIALFSMYEKRFNGLNRPAENRHNTLHGIIKKVIWFLDMAVTLLHRLLGFNADRSDVYSEEFLIAGEDK